MISFRSSREELEARLRPAEPAGAWSEASGKIAWKIDSEGAVSLTVRLRKLACPDGTHLALFIGHRACAELVVSKGRAAHACDSRKGESVPEVRAHYIAELRHEGTTVLEGAFAPD